MPQCRLGGSIFKISAGATELYVHLSGNPLSIFFFSVQRLLALVTVLFFLFFHFFELENDKSAC